MVKVIVETVQTSVPELPEVETVLRSIAPHVVGRTIRSAELTSHRVTRGDRAAAARALSGSYISAARRRGKQIFLDLDRGVLYVHLGMTGKLLWNVAPGKYTRAIFHLDDGALIYDDVRQFGRVEFYDEIPASLNRVGPDALGISFEDFYSRLKQHKGNIKALLLNQSFISGVGNIYADELLFSARVHPRASTGRLSRQRALKIHRSLIEVLQLSLEHRGSSISDYVDGTGNRGSFQQFHNVYGRAGQACFACGSPIRRILIAQRGTHYCPRCQRA